jgi:AraC family transcriptional regulator, arabinose operon regulatory protein
LTHPVQPSPVQLRTPPTFWRCEPTWAWHARPLRDHLLWCVLDGVGQLALGDRTWALRAGSAIVFRPGDEPIGQHNPRRRLLVFGMHFDVSDAALLPPRGCVQVRDRTLVAGLAHRCHESHRRADRLGARHARLCLEQLLCVLAEDATTPAPGRVDTALDAITRAVQEDPSRPWTVGELARRAALSRAQFTRRFVARTGLPPARYVVQARIERARQLLAETDASVTDVAITLGYKDIAHFSRQFKQHTGYSPRNVSSSGSARPG